MAQVVPQGFAEPVHQARPANQQGPASPRKPCRMDLPTLPDPFPEQLTHGCQKRYPCSLNFILQHPILCKVVGGFSTLSHASRRPTNKRGKLGCQTTQNADRLLRLNGRRRQHHPSTGRGPPRPSPYGCAPGLDLQAGWVSMVASPSPDDAFHHYACRSAQLP
jgi:hypothetical protein